MVRFPLHRGRRPLAAEFAVMHNAPIPRTLWYCETVGLGRTHMRRREFITFACGAAIAWPLAAHAQQAGRLPRVGVLVSASPPHPFADAFWRGLRPLGYSEGKNIAVEFHY